MGATEDALKQAHDLLQADYAAFKTVAEQLVEGVLVITARGALVYANKRIAEITDHSVPELLEMKIKALICYKDNDKFKGNFQSGFGNDIAQPSYQTEIVRKNGEKISIKILSSRVVYHGEPATVFVINPTEPKLYTDTELIRLAEAGPLPMALIRLDDGSIAYANKHFCDMLGSSSDVLINHFAREYLYDTSDCHRFLNILKQQKYIKDLRIRYKKRDGTPFLTIASGQVALFQNHKAWFTGTQEVFGKENSVDGVIWDNGKPRCEPIFQKDDLVIDIPQQRVTLRGKEVELTTTEFKLLTHIARNAGTFVPYDKLLQAVWGCRYPGDEQLLRVNLCRIRQKIGDDGKKTPRIINKQGLGYMLNEHGCWLVDR